MMDLGLGSRIRIHSLGQARPEPVFTARTSQEQALPSPVGARYLEPTRGSLCFPRRGLTPHQRSKAYASLFGSRTTQESFRESFMKELGRLEAQLAGLRQELAALTLEQSSVADQVGLLPQQLQAMRDDVSWNCPRLLLDALGSETICPRSLRGAEPLSLQLVSPTSPGLGFGTRLPVTGVLLLITWRAVHSFPPCGPHRPALLPCPSTQARDCPCRPPIVRPFLCP